MNTPCLGLTQIPCTLMRGGTSRGAILDARDLPGDPALRDRVLLSVMGSPHPLQVDGIGGGQTITSKVAIIGPSSHPGADVDYLFAQVSVTEEVVDTRASCGNMLAAVGPIAIEMGLAPVRIPETTVRVHNVNTGFICEARVATPDGLVTYSGTESIDGAPGMAATVRLTFLNAQGALTGALFPTGSPMDIIDDLPVTLIDYSIPVMMIAAAELGLDGHEPAEDISRNVELMERVEHMRLEAGRRMGLGDVSQRVTPKVALLARPAHGGTIVSRYLTPWKCHTAHAVTGGLAIAVACTYAETVAALAIGGGVGTEDTVRIEHPSGAMNIFLSMNEPGNVGANVPRTSIIRTARKLFQGNVMIPDGIWAGNRARPPETALLAEAGLR